MKNLRRVSKCDLFESTNGYGCFKCPRPDCTYHSAKDPVKEDGIGKEYDVAKDYSRWDEEIAW